MSILPAPEEFWRDHTSGTKFSTEDIKFASITKKAKEMRLNTIIEGK